MEPFYNDGITIITLSSVILTCIAMSLKILFKSKCSNVSLCFGLCSIQRQVQLETEIIDVIPNNNTNVV